MERAFISKNLVKFSFSFWSLFIELSSVMLSSSYSLSDMSSALSICAILSAEMPAFGSYSFLVGWSLLSGAVHLGLLRSDGPMGWGITRLHPVAIVPGRVTCWSSARGRLTGRTQGVPNSHTDPGQVWLPFYADGRCSPPLGTLPDLPWPSLG